MSQRCSVEKSWIKTLTILRNLKTDLPALQVSILAFGEDSNRHTCMHASYAPKWFWFSVLVCLVLFWEKGQRNKISWESQIHTKTLVVFISSVEMQTLATAAILSVHFQIVKSSYREDGDSLSTEMDSDRTRGNEHMLTQGKFCLHIGKKKS